MITVRKSITIDAPVSQIFEFMTTPENLPEIWPSMVEVSNAKRMPDGQHSFDWVYKMAGMRFKGHSDATDVAKNDHFVVKNEKGIPSTFRWTFAGENGHTKVSMQCDYTIPSTLLEKLAKPFIERQNEHEAGVLLQNLKARIELMQGATTGRVESRSPTAR